MPEGIYKLETKGPAGSSSGIIVLKEGLVVGIDGGVDYAGTLRAMFHEKRLDMIAADQMPFALPSYQKETCRGACLSFTSCR